MNAKFLLLFIIMCVMGGINSLFWSTHTNFYGLIFGALLIWVAWGIEGVSAIDTIHNKDR